MRAGTPIAVTPSGISRTTTDPAPTIVQLPTRTPGTTHVPTPRKASDPISTFPANTLPGLLVTPPRVWHKWSTAALVLISAPSQIWEYVFLSPPAMIAIPRPRTAEG